MAIQELLAEFGQLHVPSKRLFMRPKFDQEIDVAGGTSSISGPRAKQSKADDATRPQLVGGST
jgi:hypothetical protein